MHLTSHLRACSYFQAYFIAQQILRSVTASGCPGLYWGSALLPIFIRGMAVLVLMAVNE